MKAYSSDFRAKIIETHLEEKTSIYKTAQRFNVSYSFAWKLLRRYEETGEVQPRPHGGGQPAKLTPEQVEQVEQLVEADNDATLKELSTQLYEKIGIRVSRATMGRILQKLQLTRKKKSLHATEAKSERVQKLRREYWITIGEVKLADLMFIDESGVNLAMCRRYGRAKKGQRAYGECPQQRGKNITMIGAIALRGFLAPLTFAGWTDTTAFKFYVNHILVPQLWPGACVVMDNLPAHKVATIRAAIEAVGARLVYLSPYSPDFNPLENCWSKIKEFLRSLEARTYFELDAAITKAIATITSQDIIGWFTHCCYFIPSN